MTQAIRKHLRDFIAILFLVVVAAGVAGYILSNQRFYLPGWVPGLGTKFYTVEAEFETGQAVVPGQGQTVNIAGVKVGDIGEVELEDGVAVPELDRADVAHLDAGDVHRLALAGHDGLARLELGLDLVEVRADSGNPGGQVEALVGEDVATHDQRDHDHHDHRDELAQVL